MAAGLGFKTFTTGEVLTAADTNGYLMQGVLVFASAAARDAAITSPQEGQCCYLKDTDAVLTYSGSAWVGFDDSNAIQNAIVDAKGDLIGATAADTPARLAVGTNGQVLTADSTASTGLKWAAPSSPSYVGVSALRNGVSTSITGNTAAAVAYTTEQYDINTFHDNSTNNTRITIPTGYGGKYQLNAWLGNPYGTPGSYQILYLYKNGAIFTDSTFFGGQAFRSNTGTYGTSLISTTITTVATDYWEIYYQQQVTETQLLYSNFQLSYLGA